MCLLLSMSVRRFAKFSLMIRRCIGYAGRLEQPPLDVSGGASGSFERGIAAKSGIVSRAFHVKQLSDGNRYPLDISVISSLIAFPNNRLSYLHTSTC